MPTLISAREARRREGNRHRATQWRDRKHDPRYPQAIYRGNRPYFVEAEHSAYLQMLIDERDAKARKLEPAE